MKHTIKSPFNSMTKEQENAFFNADADTNKHGKIEIKKDRKNNTHHVEDKKAS